MGISNYYSCSFSELDPPTNHPEIVPIKAVGLTENWYLTCSEIYENDGDVLCLFGTARGYLILTSFDEHRGTFSVLYKKSVNWSGIRKVRRVHCSFVSPVGMRDRTLMTLDCFTLEQVGNKFVHSTFRMVDVAFNKFKNTLVAISEREVIELSLGMQEVKRTGELLESGFTSLAVNEKYLCASFSSEESRVRRTHVSPYTNACCFVYSHELDLITMLGGGFNGSHCVKTISEEIIVIGMDNSFRQGPLHVPPPTHACLGIVDSNTWEFQSTALLNWHYGPYDIQMISDRYLFLGFLKSFVLFDIYEKRVVKSWSRELFHGPLRVCSFRDFSVHENFVILCSVRGDFFIRVNLNLINGLDLPDDDDFDIRQDWRVFLETIEIIETDTFYQSREYMFLSPALTLGLFK